MRGKSFQLTVLLALTFAALATPMAEASIIHSYDLTQNFSDLLGGRQLRERAHLARAATLLGLDTGCP
jgi:hypothetical protein